MKAFSLMSNDDLRITKTAYDNLLTCIFNGSVKIAINIPKGQNPEDAKTRKQLIDDTMLICSRVTLLIAAIDVELAHNG